MMRTVVFSPHPYTLLGKHYDTGATVERLGAAPADF
jgi:hypothetical protein